MSHCKARVEGAFDAEHALPKEATPDPVLRLSYLGPCTCHLTCPRKPSCRCRYTNTCRGGLPYDFPPTTNQQKAGAPRTTRGNSTHVHAGTIGFSVACSGAVVFDFAPFLALRGQVGSKAARRRSGAVKNAPEQLETAQKKGAAAAWSLLLLKCCSLAHAGPWQQSGSLPYYDLCWNTPRSTNVHIRLTSTIPMLAAVAEQTAGWVGGLARHKLDGYM